MKPSEETVSPATAPRSPGRPRAGAVHWAAMVTAVQFLTRIPVATTVPTRDALQRAPLFFPLVGTAIGGVTTGMLWLAGLFWPVWIAVILALAAELRLTGALHEDGLADFCDGFGGGWTRDKILEILKDSRVGTYGTLGLGFAVALRVGCLVALVSEYGQERWIYWSAALIASAAVGRWMMVLAMVLVPPVVQRESLTNDVASHTTWRCFAYSGLGAMPAIGLLAVLMPAKALLAIGLVSIATLTLTSSIRRKLGGMTGDCLGCIGYISQILVLLSAAARVA